MNIQVNISPELYDVSGVHVFISYKTEDWSYAKQISEGLNRVGLQTLIVPPSQIDTKVDKKELETKLFGFIEKADFMCVIVSEKSLSSEWVKFEFKEAAQLFGRITFVSKDANIASGYYAFKHLNDGTGTHRLRIKHTVHYIPEITDSSIRVLANEILNDPEEGWYDGRGSPNHRLPKRGFRNECRLKKVARKCVLMDPKYIDKEIVDVIPFTQSQLRNQAGNPSDVLKELILDGGRLPLEKAFLNGQVDIFHTWYYVDGDFLDEQDFGIDVFIFLEHKD